MMTISGKVMFGLHALVLIGCTRAASIAVNAGNWPLALTLLAIAVIGVTAMFREASRVQFHEAGGRAPYWIVLLRRRRQVRRQRPVDCCETWWETLGEVHSGWCSRGSSRHSDYLTEAGDDE